MPLTQEFGDVMPLKGPIRRMKHQELYHGRYIGGNNGQRRNDGG